MSQDHDFQAATTQLTDRQAEVLRKHLGRGTLSLDDAAILLGVEVDDLAEQFPGRRTGRPQSDRYPGENDDDTRDLYDDRRSAQRDHLDADDRRESRRSAPREHSENVDIGLHAPTRRHRKAKRSGQPWLMWGIGGAAVVAVLLLLSGVPQSLLFSPRGVSEHNDLTAAQPAADPAEGTAAVAPEAEIHAQADTAPAPEPAAVDPMNAGAAPETAAEPPVETAAADPNATPPDAAAPPDAPLPAAPEEVAPAVATAETQTNFDAPPAPAFSPEPATPPASPVASTLYATRASTVRDAPTVTGSTVTGQLKRGDAVDGAITTGADGKSAWLQIASGPSAGGYVSAANLSETPPPPVVQALGQPRTLTQGAALHASPDEGSTTLDTLSPGISVLASAEVAGGWIEINRRAGGVGYIRKEAFE